MHALNIIFYIIVVVNAVLLIGLILIQQSKGGGFGASFGGVGESVFGARAGNHLTRLTVILTAMFFVLTLILVVISGNRGDYGRINFSVESNASVPSESAETPVPAEKP